MRSRGRPGRRRFAFLGLVGVLTLAGQAGCGAGRDVTQMQAALGRYVQTVARAYQDWELQYQDSLEQSNLSMEALRESLERTITAPDPFFELYAPYQQAVVEATDNTTRERARYRAESRWEQAIIEFARAVFRRKDQERLFLSFGEDGVGLILAARMGRGAYFHQTDLAVDRTAGTGRIRIRLVFDYQNPLNWRQAVPGQTALLMGYPVGTIHLVPVAGRRQRRDQLDVLEVDWFFRRVPAEGGRWRVEKLVPVEETIEHGIVDWVPRPPE